MVRAIVWIYNPIIMVIPIFRSVPRHGEGHLHPVVRTSGDGAEEGYGKIKQTSHKVLITTESLYLTYKL